MASSRAEPGTAAYLNLLPAWNSDGPIAVLDRPCGGWVDRAPVNPLEEATLGRAIDWAKEHAESAYLGAPSAQGRAFTLFGVPAEDTELLDGLSIKDAIAVIDGERDARPPWNWSFTLREGPWLADLRTQLDFSVAALSSAADVPEEAIREFEGSPEFRSLTHAQLVSVLHVLAGLPIPTGEVLRALSAGSGDGGQPLAFAVEDLLSLHPDATLPPSSAFGSTPPRAELMKTVLDAIAPVLKAQGFKRHGKNFSAEPEPGVLNHVEFQMGKGAPPSTFERKGLTPRYIPNYFFVNLAVGYVLDDPRLTGEWTRSHAFQIGSPFTRLEAPSQHAQGNTQEWSLADASATGRELARRFETHVADWFAARRSDRVLLAMERPFWFTLLDNRLTACRLACLRGELDLATKLLSWAALDRREWAADHGAIAWLADQYGLVI